MAVAQTAWLTASAGEVTDACTVGFLISAVGIEVALAVSVTIGKVNGVIVDSLVNMGSEEGSSR